MQAMLRQAQKMREDMAAKQEELDAREYEVKAGGGVVTVRMNGKKEVLSIDIDPVVVDPDDIETLQDILEFYEVLGKEKGISLQTQLQEGISYSGSKAEIQHLLQILLDNACKYCTAEGHITIDARQIHNGVKLTVINTAENLGEDCDILLQRFYRGKNAEGKTGFGIGLAIAEAIANRHNGHLKASVTPAGEFCVEVTLR